MAHNTPQFETQDIIGKSLPFKTTVGTSNVNLPSAAGSRIEEFFIHNPSTNGAGRILYVSIDAGTTFIELSRGESLTWDLRKNGSNTEITQLVIKGSHAATQYQAILNTGP